MALFNNKNKANGKMHAYAKSRFSHDTGICCISIFFLQNKYIYSQSAKKNHTGPDKSVNLKKKAINCILIKNQRFEGKLSRSR